MSITGNTMPVTVKVSGVRVPRYPLALVPCAASVKVSVNDPNVPGARVRLGEIEAVWPAPTPEKAANPLLMNAALPVSVKLPDSRSASPVALLPTARSITTGELVADSVSRLSV